MTAKIYVEQKGIFHADTQEELAKLTHVATQAIREGGGAITDLTEVMEVPEGPDKGTFVRYITYATLKSSLEDIEFIATKVDDYKIAVP